MAIAKVWIEEGCVVCNACEAECPDVFHVTDTTCAIRDGVRKDGVESENRDEKAELNEDVQFSLEDSIIAAAAGCPVEVINFICKPPGLPPMVVLKKCPPPGRG